MPKQAMHARLAESKGRLGSSLYAAILCLLVLAASGGIGLALKSPCSFPAWAPR